MGHSRKCSRKTALFRNKQDPTRSHTVEQGGCKIQLHRAAGDQSETTAFSSSVYFLDLIFSSWRAALSRTRRSSGDQGGFELICDHRFYVREYEDCASPSLSSRHLPRRDQALRGTAGETIQDRAAGCHQRNRGDLNDTSPKPLQNRCHRGLHSSMIRQTGFRQ